MKKFLFALIQKEGKQVEHINYIFCTDKYLLGINQQYLNHNTYTDIVTFELSEPPAALLSDVYISIDRVRENSATFQTSFLQELRRVMIHGALHLCGYGDKKLLQKKLMTQKEDYYLSLLEVSRGTDALKSF